MKNQNLFTTGAYFTALLALFLISDFVLASGGGGGGQNLGSIAQSVTGTMTYMAKLITAGSYVAGVAFFLMGLLKFKAHKDNPQQVQLSQPIVLLAIAAGLVFLPSLLSSAGGTIFGSNASQADASGGGLSGNGN